MKSLNLQSLTFFPLRNLLLANVDDANNILSSSSDVASKVESCRLRWAAVIISVEAVVSKEGGALGNPAEPSLNVKEWPQYLQASSSELSPLDSCGSAEVSE